MICSFCSLLCDAEDLGQIDCPRRDRSLTELQRIRSIPNGTHEAESPGLPLDHLTNALQLLSQAKRVLVTGRIASVQTARAATRLAAKLNATLDCAIDGHAFKNIAAIQRFGLNAISIAEARDHSDMFIVAGDDGLLDQCPRMPTALRGSSTSKQTVLLLGQFSQSSIDAWSHSGFDVWSIPCQIQDIPHALQQWYRWSNENADGGIDILSPFDSESTCVELFRSMSIARYTTVLWSAQNIVLDQADLWVERMLQGIATRNETKRCGALMWSALDGTFQQVCTWLTGFPGRVVFRDQVPNYDPTTHEVNRWLEGCASDCPQDSVMIRIDETVCIESNPQLIERDKRFEIIDISVCSKAFPTLAAGVEATADMFRADQTLLAHVERTLPCKHERVQSAAFWLEKLSQ
jgi:formylmethanofuran dehydrogenase subunit B